MSDVTLEDAVPVNRPVPRLARAEAFHEFYAAEFANLAGYAFKLTRDEELARDCAQEAFTRLLVRWVRVREPRPYLFHVLTNIVRDAWRADARRRRALATVEDDHGIVSAPDHTVADAVGRLPERHREVVLLYYYADLPVTDIAAVVRRPPGTVKWLLSDARNRLATALGDAHA